MVSVFTAGGIIVDNVVAADGRVNRGAMGGNAVYSAAGARLWLDAVGLVGRVPRNYPMAWLDRLARAGIAIDGVGVVDEDVTLGEWFFYAPDGSRRDYLHATEADAHRHGLDGETVTTEQTERFIAALRHDPPAGRDFGAFRRDHPVLLEHVPRAWLSARGAHLPANRPDAQRAMARSLQAAGLIVTLDPGSNAAGYADPAARPIADVFLPSEREVVAMTHGATLPARLDELSATYPMIAAKLAARGSLLRLADGSIVSFPALPITARDPTGAGDAYCGGMLAGLVLTGDPVVGAAFGTVSASFAVEDFGPFHLAEASRADAHRRLADLVALMPAALRGRIETASLPV